MDGSSLDTFPRLARGQRAMIAGKTGSGKTTMAIWLLRRSPGPWLMLNPKHTKALKEFPGSVQVDSIQFKDIDEAFKRSSYVVVNPPAEYNHPEILDQFIEMLFRNYDGLNLYVDELLMIHERGQPGDGLIHWLTLGRESQLSFIGVTQRPRRVSLFLFSESDYFGVLKLNLLDDRKRMYEFIGDPDLIKKIPQDRLWKWYDVSADTLVTYGPVPVDS